MAVLLGVRHVPDPIKAMEMMNQLSLDYGDTPEYKRRSMSNNPKANPEKAAEFRQALETEKEANRVLREMKRDQAIDKAREFVKEGKSAFGGGSGSTGMPKSNRDLTKAYKAGGKISKASKRADGCCVKGKTKGRMV